MKVEIRKSNYFYICSSKWSVGGGPAAPQTISCFTACSGALDLCSSMSA